MAMMLFASVATLTFAGSFASNFSAHFSVHGPNTNSSPMPSFTPLALAPSPLPATNTPSDYDPHFIGCNEPTFVRCGYKVQMKSTTTVVAIPIQNETTLVVTTCASDTDATLRIYDVSMHGTSTMIDTLV